MTSELLPQCLSVLMSWSDRFDQIVFITVTVLCLGRKLCVKEVKQLSNQWTVTIEKLFALIFLPPPPKQKEKKKIEHVGMRYAFLIIRKLCQMEVYCLDSHTKKNQFYAIYLEDMLFVCVSHDPIKLSLILNEFVWLFPPTDTLEHGRRCLLRNLLDTF